MAHTCCVCIHMRGSVCVGGLYLETGREMKWVKGNTWTSHFVFLYGTILPNIWGTFRKGNPTFIFSHISITRDSNSRVKPQSKELSLSQKTKRNMHISEDDIGSACGFQAIMRYYDSHWVCISWNTVLFISLCPGVVHWKSPVQLRMSGFWRKNYSKICLKQWGLM